MESSYYLEKPMFASAPMEDSLIDVVVMNLILNKVAHDLKQKRRENSDWMQTARLLIDTPTQWSRKWVDDSSIN